MGWVWTREHGHGHALPKQLGVLYDYLLEYVITKQHDIYEAV